MSTDESSPTEAKREIDLVNLFVIAISAFLILFIGWAYLGDKYDNYVASKKPKTAHEIKEEKIEKLFSAYDGHHYGLTRMIKNAMHDPSSYDHIATRHECDTDTCNSLLVRTSYRGKNAFGAIVKGRIVARVDLEGNITEIVSQE